MTEESELPLQATVKVEPGVCRLLSTIRASTDGTSLEFEIVQSDCPQVRNLTKVLHRMDVWDVMKMPFAENTVYQICGQVLKHSACPVPMAMIKAGEAAAELGLKRKVTVEFVD